jgi:hypothetical protein
MLMMKLKLRGINKYFELFNLTKMKSIRVKLTNDINKDSPMLFDKL